MAVLSRCSKRQKPERTGKAVRHQQHRVLCVDDDTDLTRVIKARLQPHRVEVARAGNGKEGLRAARSHRPSVVITDLGMPCGDGEFLLRRLKSRPSTASIPVLVISGLADEQRKAQVQNLGAVAMLNKPFSFDELFAELEPLLNGLIEPIIGSEADRSPDEPHDQRRRESHARPSRWRGKNLRLDGPDLAMKPQLFRQ